MMGLTSSVCQKHVSRSEEEMTNHFIELLNVTKIYHQGDNPVVALDHINIKISRGEFLTITGKSGCGKSTLINIIGGLDSPDQGKIMIDGEDVSEMEDRLLTLFRRDRIGIVFQFFNLLPILHSYYPVSDSRAFLAVCDEEYGFSLIVLQFAKDL